MSTEHELRGNGHQDEAQRQQRAAARLMQTLHRDFNTISPQLAALANAAIGDGATQYPVFIAVRESIGLGLLVLEAATHGLTWNFRMSPVEELVRKGVIGAEQLPAFKQTYGDPFKRACILLIAHEQAQFVFLPYENEME